MGFVLKWLVLFVAVQVVLVVLRSRSQGTKHAQVTRVHELANIQLFMLIASYLFWKFRFVNTCGCAPRRLFYLVFVLITAAAHLAYLGHYIRTEENKTLSLLCFVSVAVFVHVMALSVFFSVAEHVVYWTFPAEWKHPWLTSKSLHTAISVFLGILFTSIGLFSTAQDINVYKVDVTIDTLPPKLDGTTLALITDVHIGPTVHRDRVEEVVRTVNKFGVDAVAISGDLVDGFVANLADVAAPLRRLKTKYGVFYATGNHEYYHDDVEKWLSLFQDQLNITVLHNSHAVIGEGDAKLCITGVDDYHTSKLYIHNHSMDPVQAVRGCPPHSPVLMLAHQPNAVAEIVRQLPDRVDLVLSGHTHAGQMYVLWPVAYLGNTFLHGLYRDRRSRRTQVFVSAGVNYWGPPVKMWRLCEIPLIRLRAAGIRTSST